MGTVVTYSRSKSFSDRTLAKMRPLLKENGYCGYINLNTIVNQKGIWPRRSPLVEFVPATIGLLDKQVEE